MNIPKTVSETFLNQSTYYTETMSETFITWETFLQHINITNFLFPPTTSNILSTRTKSNMEENAKSRFNLDF